MLLGAAAAGICAPAIVRAQTFNLLNAGSVAKVSAVAGYTGPGNIVAGATAWWGLRANSLATIGGNAVDLVREDAANLTVATVAGGGLD